MEKKRIGIMLLVIIIITFIGFIIEPIAGVYSLIGTIIAISIEEFYTRADIWNERNKFLTAWEPMVGTYHWVQSHLLGNFQDHLN